MQVLRVNDLSPITYPALALLLEFFQHHQEVSVSSTYHQCDRVLLANRYRYHTSAPPVHKSQRGLVKEDCRQIP